MIRFHRFHRIFKFLKIQKLGLDTKTFLKGDKVLLLQNKTPLSLCSLITALSPRDRRAAGGPGEEKRPDGKEVEGAGRSEEIEITMRRGERVCARRRRRQWV